MVIRKHKSIMALPMKVRSSSY